MADLSCYYRCTLYTPLGQMVLNVLPGPVAFQGWPDSLLPEELKNGESCRHLENSQQRIDKGQLYKKNTTPSKR